MASGFKRDGALDATAALRPGACNGLLRMGTGGLASCKEAGMPRAMAMMTCGPYTTSLATPRLVGRAESEAFTTIAIPSDGWSALM